MVCASGWACDNDMRAVRALPKRVARIERAAMPQASPFALLYGSFGQFVEREVPPGIQAGHWIARTWLMWWVRSALGSKMGHGIGQQLVVTELHQRTSTL